MDDINVDVQDANGNWTTSAQCKSFRYVLWPSTDRWSGPYVAVPSDDGGYDIDVRGESWIVPTQRTKPVEDDETRVD